MSGNSPSRGRRMVSFPLQCLWGSLLDLSRRCHLPRSDILQLASRPRSPTPMEFRCRCHIPLGASTRLAELSYSLNEELMSNYLSPQPFDLVTPNEVERSGYRASLISQSFATNLH